MRIVRTLSLIAGAGIACVACQSGELLDPEDYGQSEQPLLLGSALGAAVATGNTCGLNNSMSPRCVTSVASDESHAWTAPSTGTYVFSVTSSDFFNVLVVAPFDTPFTALGCTGGGTSSTLRLPLTGGQQLQITIDGQNALCGHYTLGIARECAAACEDGSRALVDCPGTCTITNQDCAHNVEGRAQCTSTGAVDLCDTQCPCVPHQCGAGECGLVPDGCTGSFINCGSCSTCPSIFSPSIRVSGSGFTCAQAFDNAVLRARTQSGCSEICGERIKPLLCPSVPPGQLITQQIDYSFKCRSALL